MFKLFKNKQKNPSEKEIAHKLGLDAKPQSELVDMVDSLNNQALSAGSDIVARMTINRVAFKVESSSKFKSSEEQVDSFLQKMPSMTAWREELIGKARKFRKENGLDE